MTQHLRVKVSQLLSFDDLKLLWVNYFKGEQLLQTQTSFTEDRVLEAIAKITNHDDLGRRLGIEQHDLSEILKQPIQHQKQKLVATFFRTVSKQCLNWMWVDKAIKDTEIGEKAERSTSLAATATSGIDNNNIS